MRDDSNELEDIRIAVENIDEKISRNQSNSRDYGGFLVIIIIVLIIIAYRIH